MKLVDAYKRQIDYLRISVTDRCNFRCEYCKPFEQFESYSRKEMLTLEEIIEITRVFASLKVKKVRLTGGEPLIRKGIIGLIQSLADIEGIEDIALSTNGHNLAGKEKKLFKARLQRLNISLDTLNPQKFRQMTKVGSLDRVMKGIYGCIDAGFRSIKINTVLIRGFNENELPDFLAFAKKFPVEVRFIELMPSRSCYQRGADQFFSNTDAKKILEKTGQLIPLPKLSGVAQVYDIDNGKGKIGFISPMSNRFCESCNRLRLTSRGTLRLCLHAEKEIDLKSIVRAPNYQREQLQETILQSLTLKPLKHNLSHRTSEDPTLKMSTIGG